MKKLHTLLKKEVAILGASGTFGRLTSLLLKRSPEVSVLRLHDDCGLDPSQDLNLINTKCLVRFYTGNDSIHEAIKTADVIVISDEATKELNMQNSFMKKAQKIMEYTINIATYNPGAVVVVASSPVNSTVPLVSKVMEELGKLNPDKVLGMTNVENIRASSLLARHLSIAADLAWVPVVGGSTQETRVPLYSKARPVIKPSMSLLQRLTCEVKTGDLHVYRSKGEHELTNRAHATAQLVKSILDGLGGKGNVIETVFSRQEHVREVQYFSLPVILGENGIKKRIALPTITDYEDRLIKHSVKLLAVDANKALEYVKANLNAAQVKGDRRLTKIIEKNRSLENEGSLQTTDRQTTKRIKRHNIYEAHLTENAINESIASNITEQFNSVKTEIFTTKEKVHPNISENYTTPPLPEKTYSDTEKVLIAQNDQNSSPTDLKQEFINNVVAKLLLNNLSPVESSTSQQSNDNQTPNKSLVKVSEETEINSLIPIKTENQNQIPPKQKVINSKKIPYNQLYSETNKNTTEINNVNKNNNSRTIKKSVQSGRIPPPPLKDKREYTGSVSKWNNNGKHPRVFRERSDQINKELLLPEDNESLDKQTGINIDEKFNKTSLKIVESDSCCVAIKNSLAIKSKENVTTADEIIISPENRRESIIKNEDIIDSNASSIIIENVDLSSNINLIDSNDAVRPSGNPETVDALFISNVEMNSENDHHFDVPEVNSNYFLESLQAVLKSETSEISDPQCAGIISSENFRELLKSDNKETNVKNEISTNIVENVFNKGLVIDSNVNLIKSNNIVRKSKEVGGKEICETSFISKFEANSENDYYNDFPGVDSNFLERLQSIFKSQPSFAENSCQKTEMISTDNKKELMKNEDKESNEKNQAPNKIENHFKSLDLSSNIDLIKSKHVVRPSNNDEEILPKDSFISSKVEQNSKNCLIFNVPEVKSKFFERFQAMFKSETSENSNLKSSEDNSAVDESTYSNSNVNQYFGYNTGNRQLLKRINYFPVVEFSRFTSSETVSKTTDESCESDAVASRRKQNLKAEEVRNFFQEKRKQYAKDIGYYNAQSNNILRKNRILKANNIKLVKSSEEEEKSLTKKLKERQRKLIMSLQLGNFEDYGEVLKSPSKAAQVKVQNRKRKLERQAEAKEKHPSYIDRLTKGSRGKQQSLTSEKSKKTESVSNLQGGGAINTMFSATAESNKSVQTNRMNSQTETRGTPEAIVRTNSEPLSKITTSTKSNAETSVQNGTVDSEANIENSKEDTHKHICTNKNQSKELAIIETSQQSVNAKTNNESNIITENRSETKIFSAEINLSKKETSPETALVPTDRSTEDAQCKGLLNISGFTVKFEPGTINNSEEESGCKTKEKNQSDTMVKLSTNNINNNTDKVKIQENNKIIVNSERHINQKQLCTTGEKLNKNENVQSNITINSIRNQSAFTAVENKQYTDYLMKSNFKNLSDINEKETIPVGKPENRSKQSVVKCNKRPSAPIRGTTTTNTLVVQQTNDIMYSTGEMKTPIKRKSETGSVLHEKLAKSAEKIASFTNTKKNQPSACLKSVKIIRHVEKLSK